MNRLRLLLLLSLFTVGAAVLASGTSGVSTIVADRGLTGEIGDDATAHIGVEQKVESENGTTNVSVIVTNHLPDEARITQIRIQAEGETLKKISEEIANGDQISIQVENIGCGEEFSIKVSSIDETIHLTRTVDCS